VGGLDRRVGLGGTAARDLGDHRAVDRRDDLEVRVGGDAFAADEVVG
jgi:hypothetical protein